MNIGGLVLLFGAAFDDCSGKLTAADWSVSNAVVARVDVQGDLTVAGG